MTRLLVIGPEPPPQTGMEVATRALVNELRAGAIHFVRVNTSDPNDELGNRARWTLHNVALGFRHLFGVVRLAFGHGVGAVYLPITQEFPGFYRDAAFILVGRLARKPVIVHLHAGAFADFYEREGPLGRMLIRATVGKAALGIVVSEGHRPALECVMPRERVVVVENGVDLPGFSRAGEKSEPVSILFLSTLFRQKGILVFVEAFAEALRTRPAMRAVAAGYWPDVETRDEVLSLASDLGVMEAMSFPGPVELEEKAALFREADVFCFPSVQIEGQPIVIIEAMAAGVPVVASDGAGIRDLVVEPETGILVTELTASSFAEGIVALADSTELRSRMGAAARARYEQNFTQQAFGTRMIAALEPFVSSGSRHAPQWRTAA
jgi:glycosyltransferase involved in cell wall biosynthesis